MGMFSFLKNVGKDAKDEKNLQETLVQAVTKAGLNLRDFKVSLKDGEAVLSGIAASMKDLELARLIVGNYKGVEKVNDDNLKLAQQTPLVMAPPKQPQAAATAAPHTAPTSQPARMVTVRPGDTLSKIAKEYLGDANLYPQIFEANRPMIKDADEIFPGQVLRVPERPSESGAKV